MLSRVANSLFWMSRYLERAESIARIVDVNLQSLLDYKTLDDKSLKEQWGPLVKTLGDEETFAKLYKKEDSRAVTEFLTFNESNPNSILSCIVSARHNARSVRDQISLEMWEEINRLYLFIRSKSTRNLWQQSPYDFYREVKQSSYTLQGLASATTVHDEGLEFAMMGRFLERADMTSRILDVKHGILSMTEASGADLGFQSIQSAAVLRSSSAYEAFQHVYSSQITPVQVAEFLLLADSFPRSVRFCMRTFDHFLRKMSGSAPGQFVNEAEKLSGRLVAELNYTTIEEVMGIGLHEYIDSIQLKLNEIGLAMFESYILYQKTELEEEIRMQRQVQQQ
ncbi:MAG: alpha-E domain-containing protein [Blastochloris sp.]|nr:alpha-E domain-containing protein [Blastochloris sp.]